MYHASENENFLEIEEIGLQIPKHKPPPPPVPVYTQINITIPRTSPQLDSLGSSPKSDYSSYSSSSGRQNSINESTREKVNADIRNLTTKLRNVNVSNKQSPRINYLVNNVHTVETKENPDKILNSTTKKVTTELFVPLYDHNPAYSSEYHLNSDSSDDRELSSVTTTLPDNLTFANQITIENVPKKTYTANNKDTTNDAQKAVVCNVCNYEITR